MSSYEKLDAAILQRVRENPGIGFSQVNCGDALAEAIALGTVANPFRAIDKRLQALRRRKLIEYRTKTPAAPQGWYARKVPA